MERPEFVSEEHLQYLDDLRESGVTNMYGARPYIMEKFNMEVGKATKVLLYWMETFSDRHQ